MRECIFIFFKTPHLNQCFIAVITVDFLKFKGLMKYIDSFNNKYVFIVWIS